MEQNVFFATAFSGRGTHTGGRAAEDEDEALGGHGCSLPGARPAKAESQSLCIPATKTARPLQPWPKTSHPPSGQSN